MQDINRQRTFLQGPQAEPLFESTDAAVHHSQLVRNKVTDSTLWKFNLAGLILHGVQGTLLLVASQAVTSIKSFSKELTTSFLTFDDDPSSPTFQQLVPGIRSVGKVEIGLMAAVFILMSAVAHAWVLVFWKTYLSDIARETNRARWYEYALSSSVMICAIAIIFGCYDLGTLVLMFLVNAVMNLFGLLMERMNPPERTAVDWAPFIFGCIAGAAPWIVVLMYFLGGGNFGKIPGFVYGILVGYFIFFNTFPINMVLQYARVGRWAEYRFGEKVYIILSLASKSLLAWLVFGGTFQPN